MVSTADPRVRCSLCREHWSPHLCKGGEAAQGCSGQERGDGGGGSAFRMWTAPLKPGWTPPPAAGASAVALHQWMAVNSEWMSLSGLSSLGHTCIHAAPLNGQRLSPQSAQAQSSTYWQEREATMNGDSTHSIKFSLAIPFNTVRTCKWSAWQELTNMEPEHMKLGKTGSHVFLFKQILKNNMLHCSISTIWTGTAQQSWLPNKFL